MKTKIPSHCCVASKCFDEYGVPTEPGVQQDAQEYFGRLCDRLEHQLNTCTSNTLREELFENIFKGSFAEQLTVMHLFWMTNLLNMAFLVLLRLHSND